MGVPVAAWENAPEAQKHFITLTDASGESLCGGTVQQGAELTIQVDQALAGLVTADGWNMGVGPNYIVEATNAFLELRDDSSEERGCANTRIANPGASINVYALQAGQMTIRLLSAYGFGQVWASEECDITVEGSKTLVQQAGFLVDNASFQANADALSAMPYQLTVGEILAGSDSGFSVLQQNEDESFSAKYAIDASDTEDVVVLLESLPVETTDIQVSFNGFESENGFTVDLFAISQCKGASSCDGFFAIPSEQVCIADGICIESSVVNEVEGTLTTTFVTDDDAWFGIGFTTPGGGMNDRGAGSDVFVCSAEGLSRFLITAKANPATSANSAETILQDDPATQLTKNLCTLDEEAGIRQMTFTRTLDGLRPIVRGQPQAIIYARGPEGEQTLTSRHPNNRRGEVSIDLTALESGAVPGAVKQSAPWILWVHIICMSISWGLMLPLAVVIANRCRAVPGGSPSAWYHWHKSLARIGWTLQTIGAITGAYYCELYSDHLQFRHAKFGLFIIIAGFLQPLSAAVRPHPPSGGWPNGKRPTGRTLFEIYHKGIGWTAIVSGMINVFLGVRLVKDLFFEAIVSTVPLGIGSAGTGLFVGLMAICLVSPINPIAKSLTGAKSNAVE